jgi:hypothetical protein
MHMMKLSGIHSTDKRIQVRESLKSFPINGMIPIGAAEPPRRKFGKVGLVGRTIPYDVRCP